MSAPWEWRIAAGGWTMVGESHDARRFHAYDVNDHAACEPSKGLVRSASEPNEGSDICQACIEVIRSLPAGRDKLDPSRHKGRRPSPAPGWKAS